MRQEKNAILHASLDASMYVQAGVGACHVPSGTVKKLWVRS